MAGVKGRSGRLPYGGDRQKDCQKLWELSTRTLLRALTDPEVGKGRKIEISLEMVKKMAPSEFRHTGELTLTMVESLRRASARLSPLPLTPETVSTPSGPITLQSSETNGHTNSGS